MIVALAITLPAALHGFTQHQVMSNLWSAIEQAAAIAILAPLVAAIAPQVQHLLIVLLALRNLLRLIRRGPRRYTGRLARTRTIAFNWVLPMWRELWVPIAILVGLPLVTGAPWGGNLVTTDLGQWLLGLAVVLLATGITRLGIHVKEYLRRVQFGTTGPVPTASLTAP